MRRHLRRAALLSLAFGALLSAAEPGYSEDGAPAAAPDPLIAEVDAIHRFVVNGQWQAGKRAIEALFGAHSAEPQLLVHLPAIEADLRACYFGLHSAKPTALELLGRGATKFDPSTGKVEFAVGNEDKADGWTRVEDTHVFDVPFDGSVCVELSELTALSTTVVLGLDERCGGGYVFMPVHHEFAPSPGALQRGSYTEVGVYSVSAKGVPELLGEFGSLSVSSRDDSVVRYAFSARRLNIEFGSSRGAGTASGPAKSFAAAAGAPRWVALAYGSGARPRAKITGKIDLSTANRMIAVAEADRFRAWERNAWDRSRDLPRRVRELEQAESSDWARVAPAGWPAGGTDALIALHRAVFGGPRDALPEAPTDLDDVAAEWHSALRAFVERRTRDAEAAARRVMETAPEFSLAPALIAWCLLHRGADAEASSLFEECRRRDAKCAPAYDGLAAVAFRAGDLGGMRDALAAGAAARTASALTYTLREARVRAERGPDWAKPFVAANPLFVVTSDVSAAACRETARILDETTVIYTRKFRPRPKPTRSRVRVFSDFTAYARYVGDLGGDATNTLGVYLPAIRELCVWAHDDATELSNAIRHEAFHQYLDDFLDGAPIWFEEGYAEYFGFSRRVYGRPEVGQTDGSQTFWAKSLLPKFSPLKDLFLMEPAVFMARAPVHYVQSWAVVHMLRSTDQGQKLLDAYFDALLAGKSRQQAFDEVLAPVVADLEKRLAAHVAGL